MEQVIENTQIELQEIKEKIILLAGKQQRAEIEKSSPYSHNITSHIRIFKELELYTSLQLRETYLTRPAIISDIDFDLWISSEKCTNLDLMRKGNSPYAFDAHEGKIELHHIGQEYSGPFAELTLEEHNRNSEVLHFSNKPSWRNDIKLEKAFLAERSAYWKKRAQKTYIIENPPETIAKPSIHQIPQEYFTELRDICEEIYRQCSDEDLDYLSDLAKSYAMMLRVGARSMDEFLRATREDEGFDLRCTACNASNYVLCGTYQSQREKVQRYKCKECGNVFTAIAKTLITGSSFSFQDWIKFIDCLYNGYTLKQIAQCCKISEKTAHDNRIKLFYALKLLNNNVYLRGNVVIDETYLPVSFKGNHAKEEGFVMPREANKRGGENHAKGISDNLVCIVYAADETGNSIAKVAGTGTPSALRLKYVLQEHMGEEISCIFADKSPVIKKFAVDCGYEIKQEKLLRKGRKQAAGISFNKDTFIVNRYLQIINGYHSRLKRFLGRFSGISSKYLSGYLYLFAWKERNKETDPYVAYKELLRIMTEPNNYLTTEQIMKDDHLPNALNIKEKYRKRKYVPSERDKEISKKYLEGLTMPKIAAEYGITRQAVNQILKKQNINYNAYKLLRNTTVEQVREITPAGYIPKKILNNMIRDYQIYLAKQQWTGSARDFNQAMTDKFGLSANRIKNIICRVKRRLRLKADIFIYEDISFRTLETVYKDIYADYLKMAEDPKQTLSSCINELSQKHNFKKQNIYRIIRLLSTDTSPEYFKKKHRLSSQEAYNRDKAIFIDFLRWDGSRYEFCLYAAEKYGLSSSYVREILFLCLSADPERYNMVNTDRYYQAT